MDVARKGDPETVALFLDAGMDANSRGETQETALMEAAGSGHDAALLVLLKRGADLTLIDSEGYTALHRAAKAVTTSRCVQVLLHYGADPNVRSFGGNTPLTEAIPVWPMISRAQAHLLSTSLDIQALLLDRGADVNAANNRGFTPLMQAAIGGHPQVVRLPLDRGANVKLANAQGQTAEDIAHQYGHDEAAKLIEEAGG